MNIFLVMMVAGKIAMSVPMHVDMTTCRETAASQEDVIDGRYSQGDVSYAGPVTFQGRAVKRSDISFHCIQAYEAPEVEAK